ncbi:MAG: hypothetical protein PHC86_04335 [Eubacteriales bacterium]|nr:hypothetical protein [Eubacteriales bacterium]
MPSITVRIQDFCKKVTLAPNRQKLSKMTAWIDYEAALGYNPQGIWRDG